MPKFVDLQDEIVAALHEANSAIDSLQTQVQQLKRMAGPGDSGPDEAIEDAENAAATVQGVLRKIKLAEK